MKNHRILSRVFAVAFVVIGLIIMNPFFVLADDPSPIYYTITWKNWDGTIIDTSRVQQGVKPNHAIPQRQPDAYHTYAFNRWTPAIVPATGSATYTATYTVNDRYYEIHISSNNNSWGTVTASDTSAKPGDTITITATPEGDYHFTEWTGFNNITNASATNTTFTMPTSDVTITGFFAQNTPPTHTVTYKVVHGKWDDGSTGEKSETVADGGTLAAIPAVGNNPDSHYQRGSWTPSTPTATTAITEDKEYTYTYSEVGKIEYNVTFKVKKGSWDEGGKADKTVKLSKYEDEDRALVLAAGDIPVVGHNPDEGYTAGEWDIVPNTETHITSDKTYTYTYSGSGPGPTVYSVTASDDGNGSAAADPESGESGTEIKIKATPKNGYKFREWKVLSGGVELESRTSATTTFKIKDADVEVKAIFEKKDEPKPEPEDDNDDDDDHDHSDHTPPSWVLNPNEKQQLVITFAGNTTGLTAGYQEQGEAAKALFKKETRAGWKKAFSFNILKDGKADYSLKNGTLTFIIPTEYRKSGRQFAILAMDRNGNVYSLSDIDTDPNTITVALNIEGYAFELIYKD